MFLLQDYKSYPTGFFIQSVYTTNRGSFTILQVTKQYTCMQAASADNLSYQ